MDTEKSKSYEKVGRVYHAIQKGMSIEVIESLLKIEGDINYEIPITHGNGPNLLFSFNSVRPTVFNLFLDNGADFTRKNWNGRTVIHEIIRENQNYLLVLQDTFQSNFVNSILSAHVEYKNISNPCDENGISHFHAACITNHVKAAEFFLKNGVDVNQTVNAESNIFPSYSPLHLAVKYFCAEVVEILLKYGASTLLKNKDGFSPLHLLIEMYVEELTLLELPQYEKTLYILLKFVFSNSYNINFPDEFGCCKFHIACLTDDEILVESLLEVTNINQQINLNSPICPGFTALHFAASSHVGIFKLLLKNGANIELKNTRGVTPFDLCLKNYTTKDILSIILTNEEWRSIILSDNKTKLIDVISAMKEIDEFKSFLDHTSSASTIHVPFNSSLWPGYTILHLAVIFAEKLGSISKSASYKTRECDTKLIAECLKKGSDMTILNAKNSTAIHLAFYLENHCVVKYLLDNHNKDINPIDSNNLSHFHIACAACHLKAVKKFLSKGLNTNSPVSSTFKWHLPFPNRSSYPYNHFYIPSGSTAMHINAATGGIEITKLLLKYGADVYAKDKNGFTPIHRLLSAKSNDGHRDLLLSVKNLKDSVAKCGLSHLHVASYFHHSKAVNILLKERADVNKIISYQHEGIFKDYNRSFIDTYGNPRGALSFLAEYGGYTPLHFSLFSHPNKTCYKTTFMLIEKGANLLIKNAKGIASIDNLLQTWYTNADRHFLYRELEKNTEAERCLKEKFGITKLHIACYFTDPEIDLVKRLIKNGDDVNAKVYSNSPIWQEKTPLHIVMDRFFQRRKKPKVVDRFKKIILLLIKKGAALYSSDINNDTPFHLILFHELTTLQSLTSILFENMSDFNINPVNNEGQSIFHIACITGNLIAIKKFLVCGVDVNQAISYFSDFHPGSTALHLLIEYYPKLYSSSLKFVSNDEIFLQVIDIFLHKGANTNARDVLGETPLFKVIMFRGNMEIKENVIRMMKLRRILMKKFLSYGADAYALNTKGITPLELLLNSKPTVWEDTEIFLNAGFSLNAFNPISQEGYMARIFECQKSLRYTKFDVFIPNPISVKISNHPMITEINQEGRTAIHNVVSVNDEDDEEVDDDSVRAWYSSNSPFYYEHHNKVIERLILKGVEIDYVDVEGKTALHMAVALKNHRCILALLKHGIDINITDKYGKTAFAYCCESMTTEQYPPDIDIRVAIDYDDNFAIKMLAMHVYKLEFLGQYVNEQNKQLKVEVHKIHKLEGETFDIFREEVDKIKSMKISTLSLSLYEFLVNSNVDGVYMNMSREEREEVDQFFENIRNYKFLEIHCVIKLKYRQTIERLKLMEPALESLNVLIKRQLPDLCCRNILKFLRNHDLKCLITAFT